MMRRLIYSKKSDNEAQYFIMSVKTDNTGTSASNQFTIPTIGIGYNYDVKTSDGQTINGNTGNLTITFPSAGTYDIKIKGDFPRIYFNNGGDRLKLLEIKQWGTGVWNFNTAINFNQGYFYGCSNLILTNVTDIPNLGSSTNIAGMFRGCTSITTINNLNSWIMPSVTFNISHFFRDCINFNQNIGNWDMTNCGTLGNVNGGFLQGCTAFNNGGSDSIKNWNISNVVNTGNVFALCTNFNQPLDNWNFDSSITCTGFLQGASSFNQNVGHFRFPNCDTMSGFFQSCTNFNNGGSDSIRNWQFRTTGTVAAPRLFQNASSFNQPLDGWNTERFQSMGANNGGMFDGALSFNQDISMWDVSNVINMRTMFRQALSFDQNLGNWQPSTVSGLDNFIGFMNKTVLTFSTSNLDAIYNGWTNSLLNPSLTLNIGSAKHTAASTEARALLTRTVSTKTITNAVNNGSGLIRISATAHGLSTGNKCFISGVVGTTEANNGWFVTVIDVDTIDLDGSTFTNTYTSGGTLRTGYGWTVTDGGI